MLKYPVSKLLDYQESQAELFEKRNAFADITLAYLYAINTKDSHNERFNKKIELIKILCKKGYGKNQIIDVISFVDYLIRLPEELSEKINIEIIKLEEKEKMEYITSFEKSESEKVACLEGKKE